MSKLTKTEQVLLDKIEQGGIEMVKKYNLIWCYLDGKRNGCSTFDDRIEQISRQQKVMSKEDILYCGNALMWFVIVYTPIILFTFYYTKNLNKN